jgi:hypothetical protein
MPLILRISCDPSSHATGPSNFRSVPSGMRRAFAGRGGRRGGPSEFVSQFVAGPAVVPLFWSSFFTAVFSFAGQMR